MKKFLLVLLAMPALALAQEDMDLDHAPLRKDPAQLQSGARTFVNYCMNCHGLTAARYDQLLKLGLSADEIKANLMFTGDKIGDTMKVAMRGSDGKAWFGAPPPDLSVIARLRGPDWLYTYLRSFYRDPARPTGWNNLAFANVGMPNALWTLSGENKLVEKEFPNKEEAEGMQRATRVFNVLEEKGSGTQKDPKKYVLKYLQEDKKGSETQLEFDATVADLVAFLAYMSEPHAAERKQWGYLVLFAMFILILLTYFLKKEFWSDVH